MAWKSGAKDTAKRFNTEDAENGEQRARRCLGAPRVLCLGLDAKRREVLRYAQDDKVNTQSQKSRRDAGATLLWAGSAVFYPFAHGGYEFWAR